MHVSGPELGEQAAPVCFEIFNGVLALESARDGASAAQSAQESWLMSARGPSRFVNFHCFVIRVL